MIKFIMEVGFICYVVNIIGKAFEKVLDFVCFGVMEYEVEVEIIVEFICNGVWGYVYELIVVSGKNICVFYYV